MTMHSNADQETGFTLIETLVSLFVIAMLASGGAYLLITTLQGARQIEDRTEGQRDLVLAHAILADDMGSMTERVSAPTNGFDPAHSLLGTSGDRDGVVMAFVRNGWTNTDPEAPRSDLQRVEYVLEEGRLYRQAYVRPDPTEETPIIERTLIEGIERLSLRYFQGEDWSDVWETRATATRRQLPQAVEFTFVFSEDDTFRQVFVTGGRI